MINPIVINKEYSYYRSAHCWVLRRAYPGTQEGQGDNHEQTYHPNLEQLSAKVLIDCTEGCESISLIIEAINKAKAEIVKAIESA